jgi:hypothetical protein
MVANDWVAPDACTLPTADQPLRIAEFDTLFSQHLEPVNRNDITRLRLRFTGPTGLVDTVRDLTNRETACCSFFTFTLTPTASSAGTALTLDVEVPPARVDALDALADRAENARATGTRR